MSSSERERTDEHEVEVEICRSGSITFMESKKLTSIEYELCDKLESLQFKPPIEYVYNPLKYARSLHEAFVEKYFENSTKKIIFLGINPGPWGMCQTGIPFGERYCVTNWLGLVGLVDKPDKEHPKKKVTGINCPRSEMSGKKLWNLFQDLCKSPDNFFKHSFVYNVCPLALMVDSGKNITPNELKDAETKKLIYQYCDEAFVRIIKEFNFEIVIGIGGFAKMRATKALKANGLSSVQVFSIPHPSNRNAKNRSNWKEVTLAKLREHDLIRYFTGEV